MTLLAFFSALIYCLLIQHDGFASRVKGMKGKSCRIPVAIKGSDQERTYLRTFSSKFFAREVLSVSTVKGTGL